MDGKFLGKIVSAEFGIGGYNDGEIGLHLTFSYGESYGSSASDSIWDWNRVKWSEYCKWTEEYRLQKYSEIVVNLSNVLNDAKCKFVSDLKNKPIEVEIEGNMIKSWRILKEEL